MRSWFRWCRMGRKVAQITATATGLVQREAVYVAMDILVLLATPRL